MERKGITESVMNQEYENNGIGEQAQDSAGLGLGERGDSTSWQEPEAEYGTETNPNAAQEDLLNTCKDIPRKKKKRRKKNLKARFFLWIGAIVLLIVFLASPVFDIKTVTVSGNDYYTDEEVVNMSGASTGKNLLFHPGKKTIKENLSGDPYFQEVTVKRHLPSTLEIQVKERKQVAAIVYGNQYVVIDVNGLVLRISKEDPKLTTLSGMTLTKIQVGEKVKAEETATLKETLEMVSTMDKGDLYFKKIKVKKTQIKAYVYDTLIVKGTPEQMKKSIESGKLQKVIHKLYQNKTKRGTISLGEQDYISFSPAF